MIGILLMALIACSVSMAVSVSSAGEAWKARRAADEALGECRELESRLDALAKRPRKGRER